MAYSQADLDTLDKAIASGALSLELAGRKVTYRSVDELLKARDHVAGELARAGAPRRGSAFRFRFTTGRGE
jgi:hypothetical protein